jgi:hypothetical protein
LKKPASIPWGSVVETSSSRRRVSVVGALAAVIVVVVMVMCCFCCWNVDRRSWILDFGGGYNTKTFWIQKIRKPYEAN